MQIERTLKGKLLEKWNSGKVLVVLGPRQVGKTTLLKELCEIEGNYLFMNGDDAEMRVRLEGAGESKLRGLIGKHTTVFFDEAQRIPEIGLLLKIIHDQQKGIRVIASGSSSLELGNKINEPLTGRKWEFRLLPLSWNELKSQFGSFHLSLNLHRYLIFGMYPEIITHPKEAESRLKELAGSYLYQDLLQFQGIRKPEVLDKLLLALALQVGAEVNFNELSRTVGVDRATIEQYIGLLEKVFVIFKVAPLSRNMRNEINTSRKIYFYDTGIRNAIIGNFQPMELRQDAGAIWENFIVAERMKILNYQKWHGRNYFWRTYQQQEIDWVEEADGQFSIFEFKWNPKKAKPKFPKSFSENYQVAKSLVVSPANIDEFLEQV
jgi:uncharacterized protein